MPVPRRALSLFARLAAELSAPEPRPPIPFEVVAMRAIAGTGSMTLDTLPSPLAEVRLPAGTLEGHPRREDRVALLARLGSHLGPGGTIVAEVGIAEGAPPWGRLVLDLPRALAPNGLLPPVGTRTEGGRAQHVYFAIAELESECAEAGLSLELEEREFVLRPVTDPSPPRPRARSATLVLALLVAETLRRGRPRSAVVKARAVGLRAMRRDPGGRRALRDRIGAIDGFVPPGPNCLRRVLAEIMLDQGAAEDTVLLSLDVGRTGHAHFRSDPRGAPRGYDVTFEV